MAIIPSYPQANAGPEDLLLGINIIPDAGVDTPKTRSFPVSSIISLATAAVAPDISGKEDVVNKSASTSLGTSDILYPTQNAVKTYVDNNVPVIQPVSTTQTGVVNNTSLQELGGVDKLINGVRVGKGASSAEDCTVLGTNALSNNGTTYGKYNTAIGAYSLEKTNYGEANAALGAYSLATIIGGSWNTAVGCSALSSTEGGFGNLAIGGAALFSLKGVGYSQSTVGCRNVAVGNGAMKYATTGGYNVAVGDSSLLYLTTGSGNIAIGQQAGSNIGIGSGNIVIASTGYSGATGLTSGSANIIIAPNNGNATGVTTGSGNTILGRAQGLATALSNNVVLANGVGAIRFQSADTGLTTVPGQTNTLIDGDTTGKTVVTKEYANNRLVEEKTAGYTLTDADSGKIIIFKTTASQTLVIPTGLAAGFECTFVTLTGITLTVTSTGNTLNNAVGTTMTGGKRFMLKRMIAANTFVVMGDL